MATRIGGSTGIVSIGEATALPIRQSIISARTPTIERQNAGFIVCSASTTTTIPLGSVVHATLVHLKFFDNSTEDAKPTKVRISSAGAATQVIPDCIEALYVGYNVAGGITFIDVVPGAGNDTRCEYVIAGND